MKIKGEFVLREIAGDFILVPVGQTALNINGMITLDPVAALIWKGLESEQDPPAILNEILDRFEVTEEIARKDLDDFIKQLESLNLLEN